MHSPSILLHSDHLVSHSIVGQPSWINWGKTLRERAKYALCGWAGTMWPQMLEGLSSLHVL